MQQPIQINYKSTNRPHVAIQWLRELPELFSADFECAVKYTESDITQFKKELENEPTKHRAIELKSKLSATALSHPSHTCLTHFSAASSESDGFVLVLDNEPIAQLLLNFLVTTTKTQIWHNASFDFKHIHYYTGRMPLNYEDTQIRAKCLINHVDTWKANTGLKQLAGHVFGNWSDSPDTVTIRQMYDEDMIRYACTDACATYWLYEAINRKVASS